MTWTYVTADVFTDHVFGGNPLAVFPDASAIPETDLQNIAREFNLSETVFVFPPQDSANTRRLRIFTPASELPFAGHPTVGAALVLAMLGNIPLSGDLTRIVFEEGVGLVPVAIRAENGKPDFAQLTAAKLPEVGPPPPGRALLADLLSLEPGDILGGINAPQAVSCGIPFLFVPLRDRAAVGKARVRLDIWESTLRSYWAPEIMVFSRDPELPGSDIRARMFAPGMGIGEDPATGSACAALGGYLGSRESRAEGVLHYIIEQGFEMGRPSILDLEVDKVAGSVTAIRVGGKAVLVSRGELIGTGNS
ncbi:MAG: PhzF family phenazine biosynthesis protein [Gemmatimonadaceae bacterium]